MGKNHKKKEDLKKTIQELLKIKGQVRGSGFRVFYQYFKKFTEPKKIKKLNQIMTECGWSLKIEDMKHTEWYPVGLTPAYLLAVQWLMSWDEKKIEELGEMEPKISLIERLIARYFISPHKIYQMGPKQWRKHYNIGTLETPDLNLKEKYFIIRLKNFKLHPICCIYLKGFLKTIPKFVLNCKNLKCEEIKCVFKGDPYHEFKISWE